VRRYPAVSGRVRVNVSDTLALGHLLTHTNLGNNMPVNGQSAAVRGGVIDVHPLTETRGGAGGYNRAVFHGVNRVAPGPTIDTEICSVMRGAPSGTEP